MFLFENKDNRGKIQDYLLANIEMIYENTIVIVSFLIYYI